MVRCAFDDLPDRQRVVITLRDVMGHTADEVCEILEHLRAATSGSCCTERALLCALTWRRTSNPLPPPTPVW